MKINVKDNAVLRELK